jgi:GntR family transcriptional regulator
LYKLNPSLALPLYRQIVDQLREHVLSGRLQPGADLPSVRAVALEHSINPMTVSKAYSLLELEGSILRVRGVGMQVAIQKNPVSAALQQAQLLPYLVEAAQAAQRLGLSKSQALKQFDIALNQTNQSSDKGS